MWKYVDLVDSYDAVMGRRPVDMTEANGLAGGRKKKKKTHTHTHTRTQTHNLILRWDGISQST